MSKIFINIKNHVLLVRDFLFDLIFPIECLGCKKEKEWLCDKCLKEIKFNTKSNCPACGKKTYAGQYCIYCEDKFFLNGIFVAGDYHDKILKSAIKNFKYNLIIDLGKNLGEFLNHYWCDLEKNILTTKPNHVIINHERPRKLLENKNEIIIIPVPLHPRRLRFRGFNQAEVIAKKLAQENNLKIETKKLQRKRYSQAQAKLKKEKRIKNIQDCFTWQGEEINQKIILVDDVSSTGSTLNEAAKILKQNGAKEIWGLVLAKN